MKLFSAWLPLPPSVNSAFGGGSGQKRFKSRKYKDWEKAAGLICQKHPTIKGPVRLVYRFFFPDKRTRDVGNYEKTTSDFLVNHRILEDDGHHVVPAIDLRFGGYDKRNSRVEIEIYGGDHD